MKIKIKYFAQFREETGKSEEEISTSVSNPEDLYKELSKKYSFLLDAKNIKVAIDEKYVPFNHPLKENDTVVFIPPVAGG
ncbi:MAG: molybdopterin converting factor subunit 1 [Halobacteriovoraceae bacterium]|nr:molybdopterin converting factor subunit 1 [Halobacteriovoraceae bacterium]